METESPVRMVESGGAANWPSKGVATFASQLHNMAAEELEGLLNTHRYQRDQGNMAPNRSGSAPPSIEGSFSAYDNLMAQQSSYSKPALINFSNSVENTESEEQMRADPAYFAYYYSNVNLNPRLPPPIVSRENRGNNLLLAFYDDSGKGSLHFARDSLSPHEEETEVDKSDSCSDSGNVFTPGYDAASFDARHKSLVDLIQEDFPRTPSPLYNLSHSSSHAATSDELIDHDVQAILLDNLSLSASKLSDSNSDFVNTNTNIQTEGVNPDTSANAPRSPEDVQLVNKNREPRDKAVMLSGAAKSAQQLLHNEMHLPHQDTIFSQLGVTYLDQPVAQNHQVPPLYATATATAYMSGNIPFYPGSSHLSPGGVYAAASPTQYSGLHGYSAFLPSFVAEYHSANIHTQYATAAATTFASGEVIPHINKFYDGQQMQLSFSDQLQMQYLQQQSIRQDVYGGQYGGWFGGLQDGYASFSSEKQPTVAASAYRGSRVGPTAYQSSPPMMQFHASPLGSSLLPGSPLAITPGRRNELQFSHGGSNRNAGIYSGWQGQRGVDSLNDPPKKHSILDELKFSSSCRIDLSDIAGRIAEFSVDQHGSRFMQRRLENCGAEERESVFREIIPHASKLMTDVFGNYVIQKFFEHGSHEHRKQLADQISGQVLPLTLQMYGCRVVQKALEVIELDQKTELVHELDGHVLRCVRDQNGNHVIQKCIESIPTQKIGFIISSFKGQVATLSTHPYGCRVIQRILEHCGDELHIQCIVDEILQSTHTLAHDQYGNYVIQHVLERGKSHERSQIISKLSGKIVQMSQHKYASNVIEKCLKHGDVAEREGLVEEILGQSNENNNLLTMMKDQFANYVVQRILETSNDKQREVLLNRVKINLQALKKYTYGKHIVARFEQLCGEEAEVSSP